MSRIYFKVRLRKSEINVSLVPSKSKNNNIIKKKCVK